MDIHPDVEKVLRDYAHFWALGRDAFSKPPPEVGPNALALAELQVGLETALEKVKADFLRSPTDLSHLACLTGIFQGYEDCLAAERRLTADSGGLGANPISLPEIIETAFEDIRLGGRRRTTSDWDRLNLALRIITGGLRARRDLAWICREFFDIDSRLAARPGGLSSSGADRYLQEFKTGAHNFIINISLLALAVNIHTLAAYQPSPLVPADPAGQTRANRRFISKLEKRLQPLGWNFLGLFEQESLNRTLDLPMVLGLFVSPCRRSYLTGFTFKPKWSGAVELIVGHLTGLLRSRKIMRAASMLTDGRVLTTYQGSMPDYFERSRLFDSVKVSSLASPAGVLANHEARLRKYQTENPGVGCRSVNSAADVETALRYEARVESEFRQGIPNNVSPAELKKMLGSNSPAWGIIIMKHIHNLNLIFPPAAPAEETGENS